uniref:Uncharacterized protein n=1 Tax=Anopheles albimanus TaxID=7167 RepID=A0A182FIP9_ANOAL
MSKDVERMNKHALKITQQAFDGLGYQLFDPSGRHVQSIRDLVVNANLRLENLTLEPALLSSDATLEEVLGFGSQETYDVQRMFHDLLDIIISKEQELLGSEENATGSKEASLIANQIVDGRVREFNLLIEEEHRETAKMAEKSNAEP